MANLLAKEAGVDSDSEEEPAWELPVEYQEFG